MEVTTLDRGYLPWSTPHPGGTYIGWGGYLLLGTPPPSGPGQGRYPHPMWTDWNITFPHPSDASEKCSEVMLKLFVCVIHNRCVWCIHADRSRDFASSFLLQTFGELYHWETYLTACVNQRIFRNRLNTTAPRSTTFATRKYDWQNVSAQKEKRQVISTETNCDPQLHKFSKTQKVEKGNTENVGQRIPQWRFTTVLYYFSRHIKNELCFKMRLPDLRK